MGEKRDNAVTGCKLTPWITGFTSCAQLCALASHFAPACYSACSPSSCLQCLLDCCASLVRGLASLSGPGSTPWACQWGSSCLCEACVLLGWCPASWGTTKNCWGLSALRTLAKERSGGWSVVVSGPSPADIVSFPLSMFVYSHPATKTSSPASHGLSNSLWY